LRSQALKVVESIEVWCEERNIGPLKSAISKLVVDAVSDLVADAVANPCRLIEKLEARTLETLL
jgi:hypothetical protein